MAQSRKKARAGDRGEGRALPVPLLALFSSLRLMSRKRGLSGQKGSIMHCTKAGTKMMLSSRGHSSLLPMMESRPNTWGSRVGGSGCEHSSPGPTTSPLHPVALAALCPLLL